MTLRPARRCWPGKVPRWRWSRPTCWPPSWPRTDGDHAAAFARYDTRLAPLLRSKQDAAKGLGLAFAPRNQVQLAVRNTVIRLLGLPRVPNLVMGRSLRDAVELPALPVA